MEDRCTWVATWISWLHRQRSRVSVAIAALLATGLVIAAGFESDQVAAIAGMLEAMPEGQDPAPLEESLAAAREYERRQEELRQQFVPPTVPADTSAELAELEALSEDPVPGIVDTRDAEPHYRGFTQTTYWIDRVGEYRYKAFAGAWESDPSQGVLYSAKPETPPRWVSAVAPGRTGALTIIAAEAGLLTVRAESGAEYTFNVATGTFQ